MARSSAWGGVLFGMLLIIDSVLDLIGNGVVWRGVFIPPRSRWPLLPVGIVICILSIRALRRGEGKSRPYTDEDVARAKEELDRMYLKEHGSLPEEEKRKTGE